MRCLCNGLHEKSKVSERNKTKTLYIYFSLRYAIGFILLQIKQRKMLKGGFNAIEKNLIIFRKFFEIRMKKSQMCQKNSKKITKKNSKDTPITKRTVEPLKNNGNNATLKSRPCKLR